MTSSRSRAVGALVAVAAAAWASIPGAGVAQTGAEAEQRRRADDLYQEATLAETAGDYELCIRAAVDSLQVQVSRFGSWRLASCASRAEDHMLAWLGFRILESLGVSPAEWSHARIPAGDLAYGRGQFALLGGRIGAIRFLNAGDQGIEWLRGGQRVNPPVELSTGNLRSMEIVLLDGVHYARAGTRRTLNVTSASGARSVDIEFTPLSEGVREVDLSPPVPQPTQEASPPVVFAPQPVIAPPAAPVAPPAATPPASEPEEEGPNLTLPIVGIGLGVVATVGGVVLWLMSGSIRDDLDSQCPSRMGCDPSLEEDADRGRSYALFGNVLAIGGGALTALATAMLFVSMGGDEHTGVGVRADLGGASFYARGSL